MSFHRSTSGFTLAEMVVALAIILLLGSVALTSMQGGKYKSHDAQRVSDLEQIKLALRTYRDENSTSTLPSYPNGDLIGDGTGIDPIITPYVSAPIRDPLNSGASRYYYDSDYDSCGGVSNRVVVIAQTMGRTNAGNYGAVCGATAENLGNGVTPTASSTYIIILK